MQSVVVCTGSRSFEAASQTSLAKLCWPLAFLISLKETPSRPRQKITRFRIDFQEKFLFVETSGFT